MSIHDRDYYREHQREKDAYHDPKQFRNGRGSSQGWWDNSRRRSKRTPFQYFMATIGAIVIGGILIWFVRVAYVQWVMNKFQQQAIANIQQIQANAQAQQARILQEQRQKAEADRQWKLDHPTMRLTGYEKVWIPGKPIAECKRPGQTLDNATVACINGYYENRPVYVKE